MQSALLQNGVKECLICFEAGDGPKIKDVFMRCDVTPVERKRPEFAPKDPEQDLGRLLADPKAASGVFAC